MSHSSSIPEELFPSEKCSPETGCEENKNELSSSSGSSIPEELETDSDKSITSIPEEILADECSGERKASKAPSQAITSSSSLGILPYLMILDNEISIDTINCYNTEKEFKVDESFDPVCLGSGANLESWMTPFIQKITDFHSKTFEDDSAISDSISIGSLSDECHKSADSSVFQGKLIEPDETYLNKTLISAATSNDTASNADQNASKTPSQDCYKTKNLLKVDKSIDLCLGSSTNPGSWKTITDFYNKAFLDKAGISDFKRLETLSAFEDEFKVLNISKSENDEVKTADTTFVNEEETDEKVAEAKTKLYLKESCENVKSDPKSTKKNDEVHEGKAQRAGFTLFSTGKPMKIEVKKPKIPCAISRWKNKYVSSSSKTKTDSTFADQKSSKKNYDHPNLSMARKVYRQEVALRKKILLKKPAATKPKTTIATSRFTKESQTQAIEPPSSSENVRNMTKEKKTVKPLKDVNVLKKSETAVAQLALKTSAVASDPASVSSATKIKSSIPIRKVAASDLSLPKVAKNPIEGVWSSMAMSDESKKALAQRALPRIYTWRLRRAPDTRRSHLSAVSRHYRSIADSDAPDIQGIHPAAASRHSILIEGSATIDSGIAQSQPIVGALLAPKKK